MSTLEPYKKYPELCDQILKVCRRLYDRNMLAAADGNISVRVEEGVITTPSGVSKAFIEAKDLALVSLSNDILYGNPSSERLMHLAIYNNIESAKAVVHAHPPFAISWSVAFPELEELPNNCLSEVVLACGRIPIISYARPGSQAMGDVLFPEAHDHKVMVLSRHGGLSWGDDLAEAMLGMERLEHSAEILYRAKTLNKLSFLPKDEMKALLEMRKQIGNRSL